MNAFSRIALAAAIVLGVPLAPARAQDSAPPPWMEWDYATGDWDNNRTLLEDRGIKLLATYTGQIWGNLAGGIQTGAAYLQMLEFGVDADLEKAVGWKGGSFRTTWFYVTGDQPSIALTGSNFAVSGIEAPQSFRALDIWLQQRFGGDAFTLRAGLFNADADFTVSDYAALFLNAGFGWPVLLSGTAPDNPPAFPFAAPGVFCAVEPGGGWRFQTAVMQADVSSADANPHNFYWQLDRFAGFLFLNELHYRWDKAKLPGVAKLGALFDSGYEGTADGSGNVWGNATFYGIVDQMLYREPSPDAASPQGLGWFARCGFAPPDRNIVVTYFDTGFTYTGPIPGRDDDGAGLGFGWSQLSPGGAEGLSGGSVGLEMVFEATYQAQLTPWFALQPDLQFVVQPGGSADLGDALVVGLSASISF